MNSLYNNIMIINLPENILNTLAWSSHIYKKSNGALMLIPTCIWLVAMSIIAVPSSPLSTLFETLTSSRGSANF
jgi:hypothetical protein